MKETQCSAVAPRFPIAVMVCIESLRFGENVKGFRCSWRGELKIYGEQVEDSGGRKRSVVWHKISALVGRSRTERAREERVIPCVLQASPRFYSCLRTPYSC